MRILLFFLEITLLLGGFSCTSRDFPMLSEKNLAFEDEFVKIYLVSDHKNPQFYMKIGSKIFPEVDGTDPMYYKMENDFYIFQSPRKTEEEQEDEGHFSYFYVIKYNSRLETTTKYGPFDVHYIFAPQRDGFIFGDKFITIYCKGENRQYDRIILNLKKNKVSSAVPRKE